MMQPMTKTVAYMPINVPVPVKDTVWHFPKPTEGYGNTSKLSKATTGLVEPCYKGDYHPNYPHIEPHPDGNTER